MNRNKPVRTYSSKEIKLPKDFVKRDYGGHTRGIFASTIGSTGGPVPSLDFVWASQGEDYVTHLGDGVTFEGDRVTQKES